MASKAAIPFLIAMMLLTGSPLEMFGLIHNVQVANTIITKYQDMQCVENCDSPDASQRKNFEQPVWQTAQMFVGEMGCWLIVGLSALWNRLRKRHSQAQYQPIGSATQNVTDGSANDEEEIQPGTDPVAKPLAVNDEGRRPLKGWRVILLAIPASCDIIGTTLMMAGFLFVAASIFQMIRGTIVLFVGLFSVLFLRRHLGFWKWAGLFIVVGGVAIVGLAGVIEQHDATVPGQQSTDLKVNERGLGSSSLLARAIQAQANSPTPAVQTLLGIMLIALAQVFTATQFVVEESIMHRFSLTPLAVVGWEGTFGLSVTLMFQIIAHLAYGRTPEGRGGHLDMAKGWHEMIGHPAVYISSFLIMISIGGFNFFGLSVTRSVSATSRSTIDTCRTLFIWIISLGLGWETFKWLQVLGFAGLVYGTFLFNEIVRPPSSRWLRQWGARRREDELLPERPIEHN
ncbi:MAG: hypothetical protein Q9159_003586 [Coniocarpon cinnabarinum]